MKYMTDRHTVRTIKTVKDSNATAHVKNFYLQFMSSNKSTSKATIVTRSSVLCAVWGSVLRIQSHGGAMYTLFLRIRGVTVRLKKNWHFGPIFVSFCQFCHN